MSDSSEATGLSYRDAGVNIDAGNALVESIKPAVRRTKRSGVLGGIGGFGGLFEIPRDRYLQPVLVSGTDGVGTKLRLAIDLKKFDTIGIDLVAMCVNDIIVAGAEPLYFLDYYATGHLDTETAGNVIEGIAEGCVRSGTALIGGETAEMPGMYADDDFDLAGFAVGIVEKSKILDPASVLPGDIIIGMESSGPHSNGYSLIRKILSLSSDSTETRLAGKTIGELLLEPTRIYVKPILEVLQNHPVHALAHITGGGLPENLPRALPKGVIAEIDSTLWQRAEIFDWLQSEGNLDTAEMYRTFNCGIGMVVIVPADRQHEILETLKDQGESAIAIGIVTAAKQSDSSPEVLIR